MSECKLCHYVDANKFIRSATAEYKICLLCYKELRNKNYITKYGNMLNDNFKKEFQQRSKNYEQGRYSNDINRI